jgi:hypothetical protein
MNHFRPSLPDKTITSTPFFVMRGHHPRTDHHQKKALSGLLFKYGLDS